MVGVVWRCIKKPLWGGGLVLFSLCAAAPARSDAALPLQALPLAWMGPDARLDEEPNDDFSQATAVDLPVVDGSACIDPGGELDYYQFNLDHAGSLVVGVNEQPTPGYGSAPMTGGPFNLQLYDDAERPVAQGSDSLEVPRLASGSYYLSIGHVQQVCYLLNVYAE